MKKQLLILALASISTAAFAQQGTAVSLQKQSFEHRISEAQNLFTAQPTSESAVNASLQNLLLAGNEQFLSNNTNEAITAYAMATKIAENAPGVLSKKYLTLAHAALAKLQSNAALKNAHAEKAKQLAAQFTENDALGLIIQSATAAPAEKKKFWQAAEKAQSKTVQTSAGILFATDTFSVLKP